MGLEIRKQKLGNFEECHGSVVEHLLKLPDSIPTIRDGHESCHESKFITNQGCWWFINQRFVAIPIPQPTTILLVIQGVFDGKHGEARGIAEMVCIYLKLTVGRVVP